MGLTTVENRKGTKYEVHRQQKIVVPSPEQLALDSVFNLFFVSFFSFVAIVTMSLVRLLFLNLCYFVTYLILRGL